MLGVQVVNAPPVCAADSCSAGAAGVSISENNTDGRDVVRFITPLKSQNLRPAPERACPTPARDDPLRAICFRSGFSPVCALFVAPCSERARLRRRGPAIWVSDWTRALATAKKVWRVMVTEQKPFGLDS
jgi:hypothetical protein